MAAAVVVGFIWTQAALADIDPISGTWQLTNNGGGTVVVFGGGGSYVGEVEGSASFGECTHPDGEIVWQISGTSPAYTGTHAYWKDDCSAPAALGKAWWTLDVNAAGTYLMTACSQNPENGVIGCSGLTKISDSTSTGSGSQGGGTSEGSGTGNGSGTSSPGDDSKPPDKKSPYPKILEILKKRVFDIINGQASKVNVTYQLDESAKLDATLTVGGAHGKRLIRSRKRVAEVPAGKHKITLRIDKVERARLRRLPGSAAKKLKMVVTVEATDSSGNSNTVRRTFRAPEGFRG